jgi:DHA2 family multidrug resistance protein
MTENLNNGNATYLATLENLKGAGLSTEQAMFQVNRLIDQQAFTRAADDVFLVSGFIFLTMIALVWFTRRPTPQSAQVVK